LLHYLGKLKIQIFCRYGRKCKQIALLVASKKSRESKKDRRNQAAG